MSAGINANASLDKVVELLTPISQLCAARIAQTRAASRIPEMDLEVVRNAFGTYVVQTSPAEPTSQADNR